NVRLLGSTPQTLNQLADQVEQILRDTPGTVDVVNNSDAAQPEVRAVLNRQRMDGLGVAASQVGTALRTAIGGTTVTQLQVEGQSAIDITVVANKDLRNDLTALGSIPIPVGNAGGSTGTTTGATGASASSSVPGTVSTVRLDQVAELRQASAPTSISRSARQRQVSLQAGLVDRSVGDAARDI